MPLAVLVGVLVAPGLFSANPARPHAQQVLREQCLIQAADAKNPWAMAHGITAFGPAYLASDGRKATLVIVKDFLQRNLLPDGGVGPGNTYGFARYAQDSTPIEPHTNLLTKTLVLSGLPMGTTFATRWGTVTLQDLVDSVKRGFRHVPNSDEYWRDAAWTLDVISATSKPGDGWKQPDGTELSVDAVMDDALGYLETANSDLLAGMLKGLPVVEKRKQGIYGHPCGGLHLVQAVLSWARFPSVKQRWGPRVDRQLAILFYRLDSERKQYETALQQAPQYRLSVLVQMVKFYGHFLETTARAKQELKWTPTPTQTQAVARAQALLDAAVRQLEELRAFEQTNQLKLTQRQVALDLIGDACHASHGWDGWQ